MISRQVRDARGDPFASRLVVVLLLCVVLAGCRSVSEPWRPLPAAEAAMRLPADRVAGRRLFEACAACHGADGSGSDASLVPRIAGQHYSVIIRQLADFRAGRRHDARMQQAAMEHQLESPQALADIATYVNLLPRRMTVNLGGTQSGELGQRLYENNCASCHGGAAQGDDHAAVPRLAGQHRNYLIRQFRDIADLLRPPVGRKHAALLAPLDYQEREALADFLSRLL